MPQVTDRFKGASTARSRHLQSGRSAPTRTTTTRTTKPSTRPSARSIRSEANKRNAARAESKKVTSGMTKEERAALNAREGESAQEMANDPAYQQVTQLSTLDKTKRKEVLDFLREVADEEFSDYFEDRRQEVITDAKFAMETIAQQFGEFNEETKRELGQAIEKLDVDSAKELATTFTAVNQSGLMNSGMMAILAQRIIDDETFSARQLQEDLDADLRFSAEKQALQEKGVDIDEKAGLAGIENERVEAVEVDMFQRAGFEDTYELLNAIDSGFYEMDPVTGEFRDTRGDQPQAPREANAEDVTPAAERQTPTPQQTRFDAAPEAIATREKAVEARRSAPIPVEERTTNRVVEGPSREIQEFEAKSPEGQALQSSAEIRRRARLDRNSQQV
jgi:hypothetical protein